MCGFPEHSSCICYSETKLQNKQHSFMIVRRFRITILKLNSKYRLFYQDFYFILFFYIFRDLCIHFLVFILFDKYLLEILFKYNWIILLL